MNVQGIFDTFISFALTSACTWLFTTVLRLRKDMDAAHKKIRILMGDDDVSIRTRPAHSGESAQSGLE